MPANSQPTVRRSASQHRLPGGFIQELPEIVDVFADASDQIEADAEKVRINIHGETEN